MIQTMAVVPYALESSFALCHLAVSRLRQWGWVLTTGSWFLLAGCTGSPDKADDAPPANRQLAVDEAQLRFGPVIATEAFEWPVVVRNDGSDPIRVLSVDASCGCTRVDPPQFTVAPYGSLRLVAKLDIARSIRSEFDDREFSVRLTPHLQDEKSRHKEWMLRGTVYAPFRAEPAEITLSNVVGSDEAAPTAYAAIETRENVAITGIDFDRNVVAATLQPADKSPLNYILNVVLKRDLAVGSYLSPVRINYATGADRARGSAAFPVRASVVSEIHAVPGFLPMGPVPLNMTMTRQISLNSRRGRGFRIERVDGPTADERCRVTADIVASSDSSAADQSVSRRIDVTARPGTRGLHVFTINCLVVDADGVAATIPCRLTCVGVTQRHQPEQ